MFLCIIYLENRKFRLSREKRNSNFRFFISRDAAAAPNGREISENFAGGEVFLNYLVYIIDFLFS